jgi:hypothetical protein
MANFTHIKAWAYANLPTGEGMPISTEKQREEKGKAEMRWARIKQAMYLAAFIIAILIVAEIVTAGLISGIIFGIIALAVVIPLAGLAAAYFTAPPPPAPPTRVEALHADAGYAARAFAWTADAGDSIGSAIGSIYNWRWTIATVFTAAGATAAFGAIWGYIAGCGVWLLGCYRNNPDNFNYVAGMIALVGVLFFLGLIPGGIVGLGLALVCMMTLTNYAANQIKVIVEMYNTDPNSPAHRGEAHAHVAAPAAPSATHAPAVASPTHKPKGEESVADAKPQSQEQPLPPAEKPWWQLW